MHVEILVLVKVPGSFGLSVQGLSHLSSFSSSRRGLWDCPQKGREQASWWTLPGPGGEGLVENPGMDLGLVHCSCPLPFLSFWPSGGIVPCAPWYTGQGRGGEHRGSLPSFVSANDLETAPTLHLPF